LAGTAVQLCFNLSRSEDLCLIALTRRARVGVDVEFAHPFPEQDKIMDEFFSVAEQRCIQEARDDANQVFYHFWTAKEAYLKALGFGIGEIKKVEFATEKAVNNKLRLKKGVTDQDRWYIHHLRPAPSFIGCLVVETAARLVEFALDFQA
jgi:4'-phosphopantetheinyl transferase